MPYKTRAKCPARELAATPNSHPNSLARDKLINSAHPGPARLARALEFSVEIAPDECNEVGDFTVEICAVEIFVFTLSLF